MLSKNGVRERGLSDRLQWRDLVSIFSFGLKQAKGKDSPTGHARLFVKQEARFSLSRAEPLGLALEHRPLDRRVHVVVSLILWRDSFVPEVHARRPEIDTGASEHMFYQVC